MAFLEMMMMSKLGLSGTENGREGRRRRLGNILKVRRLILGVMGHVALIMEMALMITGMMERLLQLLLLLLVTLAVPLIRSEETVDLRKGLNLLLALASLVVSPGWRGRNADLAVFIPSVSGLHVGLEGLELRKALVTAFFGAGQRPRLRVMKDEMTLQIGLCAKLFRAEIARQLPPPLLPRPGMTAFVWIGLGVGYQGLLGLVGREAGVALVRPSTFVDAGDVGVEVPPLDEGHLAVRAGVLLDGEMAGDVPVEVNLTLEARAAGQAGEVLQEKKNGIGGDI